VDRKFGLWYIGDINKFYYTNYTTKKNSSQSEKRVKVCKTKKYGSLTNNHMLKG